jgi:Regulator of chromosome condensation (RCC1) repeat
MVRRGGKQAPRGSRRRYSLRPMHEIPAVMRSSETLASRWGDDFYGQLGDGPGQSDSAVPVAVSGITDATAIEAGGAHTCARLSTGAIKCWGWNNWGQLGDATVVPPGGDDSKFSSVPVSVIGITDATALTGGSSTRVRCGPAARWSVGGTGSTASWATAPTRRRAPRCQ